MKIDLSIMMVWSDDSDSTNYVLFVGNWQNISVDATARALDISKIR